MLDVAAAARVSVATVSAVVNGTAVVSPELTARIEEAIRAIGPRAVPRLVRMLSAHEKTLQELVRGIRNGFFPFQ